MVAGGESFDFRAKCGSHGHDADEATIRQTEGPYFKPSSPQRADLVEPDTKARLVEINGQVLTSSCRPVERALVDLLHADEHGEYDNAGFRYRGHLFTDGEGRYRFRTILPALYPGRTRHYHVKVQAPERPVLTTQLYLPDEPTNRRDRPESWFQIPFQWRHLLPMTA
jgi:protocatechuate 3,4-dioxygenase beta subunit